MKTKLIIAFAAAILLNSKALGQTFRYADLEVDFTFPDASSIVNSPSTIHYTFKVKNLGPDTIFPSDTLGYSAGHSFQFLPPKSKIAINKTIAPQDSFFVNDSIEVNSGRTSEKFNLFFVDVPMAYGPDKGKLYLQNEFSEDRENNRSMVTLKHVGNASEKSVGLTSMNISPNPSPNAIFRVSGLQDVESIQLINNWGQSVPVKIDKISNSTFTINLLQNIPGVYFAKVMMNGSVSVNKLIVP